MLVWLPLSTPATKPGPSTENFNQVVCMRHRYVILVDHRYGNK
ncbi:MAG: hypothetical protein U5L72_10235 [Bacteroidales bacterium]|nr:hypothetical protein [Bacteroidales bacterium]